MAKIIVGMSGGVDSAVAAYILKMAGHDVSGVTLRVWMNIFGEDSRCCEIDDARKASHMIGIPYYVENCVEEFNEKIIKKFINDYISGLTLSGGDPLYPGNIADVEQLLKSFKDEFPGKTVWLYTGDLWEEIKHLTLMKYVDVVVDGPFDKNLKDVTLCWKGSSNQRVIDVKESLETGEVKIHCPDHYSVLDPDSVHGSSRSGVPCMY